VHFRGQSGWPAERTSGPDGQGSRHLGWVLWIVRSETPRRAEAISSYALGAFIVQVI
jgi:hypothetical protein